VLRRIADGPKYIERRTRGKSERWVVDRQSRGFVIVGGFANADRRRIREDGALT